MFTIVQTLLTQPVRSKSAQKFVFRLDLVSAVKDSRMGRILELADGKSVEEIAEVLYAEELRAGAWLVDIGVWRSLFDQDVVKTLNQMADLGYIQMGEAFAWSSCLARPGLESGCARMYSFHAPP